MYKYEIISMIDDEIFGTSANEQIIAREKEKIKWK